MYNAILYRKNNNLQKNVTSEFLDKISSKFKWKKSNNRIIDLGCGVGTVTNMLKNHLPDDFNLLGIDINKNMVKLAIDTFSDGHTTFDLLDIVGDLPEELKGNFNHVFSFFTLQWIVDQERAFNNIYNLLEQDGECFLIIVSKTSTFDVYRSLAQNNKWNIWVKDVETFISPYHDSQVPEKEITQMMEKIGFDNIEVEHKDALHIYKDMEAMKKSLMAINPFKIPTDKYDAFWDDYLNLWKQYEGLQDYSNKYFVKYIKYKLKVLVVHAHKPVAEKN